MEIRFVETKKVAGSAPKRSKTNTAGLTSAYQRTGISSSSLSAVETTAGYLMINIAALPWYSPFPQNEQAIDLRAELAADRQRELAEAYKAMASENREIAEAALPVALEGWPAWEE